MEKKGLSVKIRRLMPLVTAIGVVLIGGWYMLTTAPGHIPDVWSHIYRMAGILNGDVMARPVDSVSYLHGGTGNVGGHVDWNGSNIPNSIMTVTIHCRPPRLHQSIRRIGGGRTV